MISAEHLRDAAHADILSLEREARRARNDHEPVEIGKLVQELLGKPVGEVRRICEVLAARA